MEVTQDHDEIRRWAEAWDGRPQVFDNPRAGSDPVGLRINFPGPRDDTFLPGGSNAPREVSWEEFFAHFDRLELVMESLSLHPLGTTRALATGSGSYRVSRGRSG
jgi:hypothetical protein